MGMFGCMGMVAAKHTGNRRHHWARMCEPQTRPSISTQSSRPFRDPPLGPPIIKILMHRFTLFAFRGFLIGWHAKTNVFFEMCSCWEVVPPSYTLGSVVFSLEYPRLPPPPFI